MRNPVGMTCKLHGFQYGRTRCKICGHDPLKVSSPSSDAGLPRTGGTITGDEAFSFDVLNDQFQEIFDGTP